METNYHDFEIVSKNPQVYFWSPTGEIKKVTIVDCDFDKRVTFTYEDGTVDNYKWGYIYNTYGDAVLAKHYHEDLYEMDCHQWLEECSDCIDVWNLLLSNYNYSQYRKFKRKETKSKTSWFVSVNDQSYFDSAKFKTLKSALDYFRKLNQGSLEFPQLGEYNSNIYLLTFEDNTLYYEDDKRLGYVLKSRHLGKGALNNHGNSLVYKVEFTEDQVTGFDGNSLQVNAPKVVKLICRGQQVASFKKGDVVFRENAKMKPHSAKKVNPNLTPERVKHINENTLSTGGMVMYARNSFEGVILEGGEDITADELLYLRDGCGLPFGGSCYINSNGKYSGEYNTD